MPTVAQSERQALCDLLEESGPLAPTLCEGWATSDLAAHLYVREARFFESGGILIPQLAGVTERAMNRAKRELGYAGLIERIRKGPPYPARLVDAQMNAIEYFVHHEDVRRADAGAAAREDEALDDALWPRIKLGARFMARKLKGAGLELHAPGRGTVVAKHGSPMLRVEAGPQELMLLLFGRGAHAHLDVAGDEDLLLSTSFGI